MRTVLIFILLFIVNSQSIATSTKKCPNGADIQNCEQWDGYLTSTFGGYSAFRTCLARAYCSGFSIPSDFVNPCTGLGLNDMDMLRCLANAIRQYYAGKDNQCKQISCMMEHFAEQLPGWSCTQLAYSTLLSGHVITQCTGPNGEIVDIDPQSGTGNFVIRTAGCTNSWNGNLGRPAIAASSTRQPARQSSRSPSKSTSATASQPETCPLDSYSPYSSTRPVAAPLDAIFSEEEVEAASCPSDGSLEESQIKNVIK